MSVNFADILFWWDGFAGRKVSGTDYTKLYDLSNTTDPTFSTNNPAFIKNGDVVYAGVDGTKVMPVGQAPGQGTVMFWGDVTRNTSSVVHLFSSNAASPDHINLRVNTDGTMTARGRGGEVSSSALEWQPNGNLERWFFVLQYTASAIKVWRGNIVGNLELVIDTTHTQTSTTPDTILVGTDRASANQTNVKCAFLLSTTQIVSAQTIEDVYVGKIPIAKIKGTPEYAAEYFLKAKIGDDSGTLETLQEHIDLLTKLRDEEVYNSTTIGLVAGAYKADKWYSFKGSDMDVVRATSGTRINRSGVLTTEGNNIVRADYNGGVLKGNNVEPSATNLLQRSEEFDNAYWTKTGTTVPTVTANAIAAPDGNTTADLLTGTGGISMRLQRTLTVTTGAHTLSFYVKNNTETIARFNVFDGSTDRGAAFTFASESFTSVSANLTVGFEKLNDGWYRIFGTYPSFGTTTANVQLFVSGTLSLYYWGAQLETGSVATSYIKTDRIHRNPQRRQHQQNGDIERNRADRGGCVGGGG
jgi:hypothetical protein